MKGLVDAGECDGYTDDRTEGDGSDVFRCAHCDRRRTPGGYHPAVTACAVAARQSGHLEGTFHDFDEGGRARGLLFLCPDGTVRHDERNGMPEDEDDGDERAEERGSTSGSLFGEALSGQRMEAFASE